MSELREGQILKKAKELCRRDGKAWSLHDFARKSGVTMFTVVANARARTEYLNRAKAFLELKQALLEKKIVASSPI
jgi:hypothetical protein